MLLRRYTPAASVTTNAVSGDVFSAHASSTDVTVELTVEEAVELAVEVAVELTVEETVSDAVEVAVSDAVEVAVEVCVVDRIVQLPTNFSRFIAFLFGSD